MSLGVMFASAFGGALDLAHVRLPPSQTVTRFKVAVLSTLTPLLWVLE